MEFNYKIYGVKELESSFKKIGSKVMDAKEPLRESANIVVEQSIRNFDDQGYTYGRAWTPLKPSTRKDRSRKGYGSARPILVRSGTLKKGARVTSVTGRQATVENKVDYAPYHQFGTSRMPKRTILAVTDKVKHAIGIVFTKWISKIIR